MCKSLKYADSLAVKMYMHFIKQRISWVRQYCGGRISYQHLLTRWSQLLFNTESVTSSILTYCVFLYKTGLTWSSQKVSSSLSITDGRSFLKNVLIHSNCYGSLLVIWLNLYAHFEKRSDLVTTHVFNSSSHLEWFSYSKQQLNFA